MLLHVPQLEAHHRQGRDILLTFRNDVGSILTEVVKCGDAVHLATAASILHREMLGHKLKSDVTFHSKEESRHHFLSSCASLNMAQILNMQYINCFAKYKEGAKVHRHLKDREMSFAVYIGLTVFAKTRKR